MKGFISDIEWSGISRDVLHTGRGDLLPVMTNTGSVTMTMQLSGEIDPDILSGPIEIVPAGKSGSVITEASMEQGVLTVGETRPSAVEHVPCIGEPDLVVFWRWLRGLEPIDAVLFFVWLASVVFCGFWFMP